MIMIFYAIQNSVLNTLFELVFLMELAIKKSHQLMLMGVFQNINIPS
jgi:hypothetical protein